jgi:hypothetical protein
LAAAEFLKIIEAEGTPKHTQNSLLKNCLDFTLVLDVTGMVSYKKVAEYAVEYGCSVKK